MDIETGYNYFLKKRIKFFKNKPNGGDVISRFLYEHKDNSISINKSASIVASELIYIYKIENVDTKEIQNIIKSIKKLYAEIISVKKNDNRTSDLNLAQKKKASLLNIQLEKVFDITATKHHNVDVNLNKAK